MNKTAFILVLLTVLFSCTKRRLSKDREILVGKWEWAYSIKTTESASGNPISDTIFPADVIDSYNVVFLKKGYVLFEENDVEKHKYRTVFGKFQITGSVPSCFVNNGDVFDFDIYLDGDDNNGMNGCVSSDSLMFYQEDFPFVSEYDENNGVFTTIHLNVFTRVN